MSRVCMCVCVCVMKGVDRGGKRAHCFIWWLYMQVYAHRRALLAILSFCLCDFWIWNWNVWNDWTSQYGLHVSPLISQQREKTFIWKWMVYVNQSGIYVIVAWLAKHILLSVDVTTIIHSCIHFTAPILCPFCIQLALFVWIESIVWNPVIGFDK